MLTPKREKELKNLAEAIAKNMSASDLDALIASLEQSLKNPPPTKKGDQK